MFSLQFKKTKDKSKQRGNQFRKSMIFIVVLVRRGEWKFRKKKLYN